MYGWGSLQKKLFQPKEKEEIIQCVGALPFTINNCIPSKFFRFPALKGIYFIDFDVYIYIRTMILLSSKYQNCVPCENYMAWHLEELFARCHAL